jgi:2-polyprenyl-6-methoxyphenol hydroxylase-like FAD-dependent oxidoreductase
MLVKIRKAPCNPFRLRFSKRTSLWERTGAARAREPPSASTSWKCGGASDGITRTPERLYASDLCALLAQRAPWYRRAVERVDWGRVVRFERRLARRFGESRVWLAGDAAHGTSPLGAQSMNAGLSEAHDLVRGIAARADPSAKSVRDARFRGSPRRSHRGREPVERARCLLCRNV